MKWARACLCGCVSACACGNVPVCRSYAREGWVAGSAAVPVNGCTQQLRCESTGPRSIPCRLHNACCSGNKQTAEPACLHWCSLLAPRLGWAPQRAAHDRCAGACVPVGARQAAGSSFIKKKTTSQQSPCADNVPARAAPGLATLLRQCNNQARCSHLHPKKYKRGGRYDFELDARLH